MVRCWIRSCGPDRVAGTLGGGGGGREEALAERGRVELLVPLPRPSPSSETSRCGA